MKKIPTLFVREYEERANGKGKRIVGVKNELTSPDLQCVLDGKCIATIKWDGSSMAFIKGQWYKRYDAKNSKKKKRLKEKYGDKAIATQEHSDPVTGSKPYWVPLDENEPADKWYLEAVKNTAKKYIYGDWSYEAIGPHFQSNPEKCPEDIVVPHGKDKIEELSLRPITIQDIEKYLKEHEIEGIVFWCQKDKDEFTKPCYDWIQKPLCKIKRSDFNLQWPIKK